MVSPGCDALCCHLPLRLPARNHLSHNDGVLQAIAPGHQRPASTLHALGCELKEGRGNLREDIHGLILDLQGQTFIGQPLPQGAEVDETAANHRLHYRQSVLKPHFQGCGAQSEDWEEERRHKGGIKVHSVIHANEGVPCYILFTSAAKHDHFLLAPDRLTAGDTLVMDRAYIDYEKFEQMTQRGVIYVTKMKQNLTCETLSSTYYMNEKGQMQWREENVVFRKEVKTKETDENGEQKEVGRVIWVTHIANLLLTLLQRGVTHAWSFSGLATIVRIMLMYYIDVMGFLEHPEKEREVALEEVISSPPATE